MCYHISLHSDVEFTQDAYPGIEDLRDTLFDSSYLEVVRASSKARYNIVYGADHPLLVTAEWGFLPAWAKDEKEFDLWRLRMCNARAERILDDPKSIWYKHQEHRGLIPVDGIFEHRHINTWKKKVPYYMWLKERGTFNLPCMVKIDEWPDDDGVLQTIYSFSLITCDANETAASVHNNGENKHRMPLYLTQEMEKAWIDPHLSKADMREILQYQMPAEQMQYHPVYTISPGAARKDGLPAYAAHHWENLPPLGDDNPHTAQMSMF